MQSLSVSGKEKVSQLVTSLDLEHNWLENDVATNNYYLIVPCKIEFETVSSFVNRQSYFVLETTKQLDTVLKAQIVLYKPQDSSNKKLSKNTIASYYGFNKMADDGTYVALSAIGKYLEELRVLNGVVKERKTTYYNQSTANKNNATICIDWYLVTSYYDENGNFINQESEYLGQSCYSCGEITPWGLTTTCDYINDDAIGGSYTSYESNGYRGSIQFQWNNNTKSCSWAQPNRITKAEGISKLDCAFNQLTGSQKQAFQCAYDFQKNKIQTYTLPAANYKRFVSDCCPNCISTLGNDNGARCDIKIDKGDDSFKN